VLVCALLLTGCMQPVADSASLEMAVLEAVTVTPRPTLAPAPTATEAGLCYLVTADESLYIRDAADYETGAVVGYLAHGEVVQALSAPADGWLSLAGRGWVSALYVEPTPCP
jgi:hypothetical protein